MDAGTVGQLWDAYKRRKPCNDIHPDDRMHSGEQAAWYWGVGESAVNVICTVLTAVRKSEITTVLDFGCGHGRVARHLRAFFPDARLLFCERIPGAAEFCAERFSGRVSSEDDLPEGIDLIWVGSVFTHIDAAAMQALFDKLAASLSHHGVLVATFHGRKAVIMNRDATQRYINDEKWSRILSDCERTGLGYEDYDNQPGYGVSLTSAARAIKLSENNPRMRLVTYVEAGWAEHQDVAAWAAMPLDPASSSSP